MARMMRLGIGCPHRMIRAINSLIVFTNKIDVRFDGPKPLFAYMCMVDYPWLCWAVFSGELIPLASGVGVDTAKSR